MTDDSTTITVRDHSRQCEHGYLWGHWLATKSAKWWNEPDCLGGHEMVLRRRSDGVWEEVDQADG
jgi:hypothetical protein